MTTLTHEKCVPCRAGSAAATAREKSEWMKSLPEWRIKKTGIPELERAFKFEDFKAALDFAVKIGQQAEEQDHHPAIDLEWGKAVVRWSTHKIKDLHRNDFIMAAKTDAIYKELTASK